MKRKKILVCLAALACLFRGIPVNAEGEQEESVEIKATAEDEYPIPDKYTTGARGELTKVELGDSAGGISFKISGTKDANVLNFGYPVAPIPDTAVIENCDFSDYNFNSVQEGAITDRDIKITFRNCKFGAVSKEAPDSHVFFVFENCSLKRFTGSNASFENCAIGGSYEDGMHPFRHVTVKNCYFSDFNYVCSGGEYHTDGVHIFGKTDIDVTDLTFEHCRFEAPYNQLEGSNSYVNACFMLAPEYSDASDVVVKDCIMNGGGYTVYASDGNKHGTFHSITDSRFENIRFGEAHLFGDIYPNMLSEGAEFINKSDVDSLYIGYVGKEDGKTVFSVSNDTNAERKLRIVTDQGAYTETIPACPGGKEMRDVRERIDYPFDIRISIPVDATYAVCYDVTDPEDLKQIRFVNYGGEAVYLTPVRMRGEEEAPPTTLPWESGYTGFADYDGGKFYVTNGKIDTTKNGVVIDPHSAPDYVWYFLANGQVQMQHTGLAEYDSEWFYIEKGKVATDMNAFVDYDGGKFAVGAGRIISEYSGLMQDPQNTKTGDWYFFANGQAQTQYTGLAFYDEKWFYVIKGKLTEDYTGAVEYDGESFNVVNGMVRGE
ncbi:MAG: hypothetical protein J6N53_12575 [Lachnospiraceae bacterium]|nr:hypothetical protein [Lachnospiraceae bacterium]